jgi:hypothetical protein
LLCQAMDDMLITVPLGAVHPSCLTSADLIGIANLLAKHLQATADA